MSEKAIPRLVLASANPDKAREMAEILLASLGAGVEIVARPFDVPDVDETGETLEDNARLKASAIFGATGLCAVADDTGLEVDALDGRPGVRTARYAGQEARPSDNIELLLRELEGNASSRAAHFRTVALAVLDDGTELVAEGSLDGTIAQAARGTRGFGYDPVFVPDDGDGRTLGEMSPEEKHEVSHRGRAFRALGDQLRSHFGLAPGVE